MPDTMSFPKTLDEFMEQYKIVDTEQVYTNGTELVPIFRIKQWEDAHKPMKGKKFIEIVAKYLDPAICTYPEYRGKPYFSIRYEENGELFEGFGTYNPKVLSEYIREYFMGADVVERKKGKWARDEFGSKCSCCGLYAYRDKFEKPWESNFCPNCGADMREEEKDE